MELWQQFLAQPLAFLGEYIVPFVVVLSVLVFVHEWGHFIVARICGVKVKIFSIGFGKEIVGFTDKKGMRWKFSWIPLGGYVQMFGDVDPASARHADGVQIEGDEDMRPFTEEEKKVAFYTQPVGKRAAIVAAGPAINFLLAIVIMTGLFAVKGEPYTPAIAATVVDGQPAALAGIQPDDKIIEVNGKKVLKFQELVSIVSVNLDTPLELKVLRMTAPGEWAGEPVSLTMTPKRVEQVDRFGFKHMVGRIGIVSPKDALEMRAHSLPSALVAATVETWNISAHTLKALGQMVLGTRSRDELGGILRIGAYAGDFAKEGIVALATFAALLSVNLGLINLLPIPMLDGGHLAFYGAEVLKGRPLSENVQEYALRGGLIFLLGIMVFATWNDLVQLRVIDYLMQLVS